LFLPVVVGPQLQIPHEILVYVRNILGAHPLIAAQLVIYGSRGVYTGGYGMADPHLPRRPPQSIRHQQQIRDAEIRTGETQRGPRVGRLQYVFACVALKPTVVPTHPDLSSRAFE
jgi:hypothetical protein